MMKKRTFRRLVPLFCCLALLKVYMITEGVGVYPDQALLQDAGNHRPPTEGDEVPSRVSWSRSVPIQSTEGGLGESPPALSSVGHSVQEAPSAPPSGESEAIDLPLRYRSRESDVLAKDGEPSDDSANEAEVGPVWLRITDDVYTYSAFWDSRAGVEGGPVARVLGVWRYRHEMVLRKAHQWTGLLMEGALNCSCLLWYEDRGGRPEEGELRAFVFEEGLKVFVGTFFLCHPRSEVNDSSSSSRGGSQRLVPYAVSLVPKETVSAPYKLIYLSDRGRSSARNLTTGVCVRPLHGPYDDLRAMTQFVAYYHAVLGVSHFYFYDFAVSSRARELLRLFSRGGVAVHLLPWNLPTSEWHELWDTGSLVALNDCVYRSSGRHGHVAVVDLDEFVVPRAPEAAGGLANIYRTVLKYKKGREGDAALILNAFFCYDFGDNAVSDEAEAFPIFRFMTREARLWPPKSRSKMIVVPEHVLNVGHHMVHRFLLKTSKNHASPKYVSVMHHYRACADLRLGIHGTGSLVLEQENMTDATMMKYKNTVLASSIVRQYRNYLEGQ